MVMLRSILIVALGGALGSAARFVLSKSLQESVLSVFPYGTMAVNLIGCLLIGTLLGLADRHVVVQNELKMLLVTGFCGGFTTFSTFCSESLQLFKSHQLVAASLYIGVSVAAGIILVYIGMRIME